MTTLGDFTSAVPFRKDASNPLSVSNGTGTYTGHAFAGPGWVSSFGRQDVQWNSGFSGGSSGQTRSRAQADDFVISGPPGSVSATLHFRVRANLGNGGGFVGNGAHQSRLECLSRRTTTIPLDRSLWVTAESRQAGRSQGGPPPR